MADLAASGFIEIAHQRLKYIYHAGSAANAPMLVLLHEGLGSAGLWGDFPAFLAAAAGYGVFAYSRAGYGASSLAPLPRPLTYMHDEADQVLGPVLDAIRFERGFLVGHSGGASIAAIYAGKHKDPRISGLCLIAPHFFAEEITIAAIQSAKNAYVTTDLRFRLARWHGNADAAFRGWNDAWLDPEFRALNIGEFLPVITSPVLVIQGGEDQYGSAAQVELAQRLIQAPVDVCIMPGVTHAPHREAREATIAAIKAFTSKALASKTFGPN